MSERIISISLEVKIYPSVDRNNMCLSIPKAALTTLDIKQQKPSDKPDYYEVYMVAKDFFGNVLLNGRVELVSGTELNKYYFNCSNQHKLYPNQTIYIDIARP